MVSDSSDSYYVDQYMEALGDRDCPGVDKSVRGSALSGAQVKKLNANLLDGLEMDGSDLRLMEAILLLWHDRLDDSHDIVQAMGHPEASYLHGMMHRREGDFGNAKYWFRRAQPFENQAEFENLVVHNAEKLGVKIDGSHWDPAKFVDMCQHDSDYSTLKLIQVAEFRAIAQYILKHK